MAQSYNGGAVSVMEGMSIGAISAPQLASPSPLRRTRGGRFLRKNSSLEREELLTEMLVDTKFPSPPTPTKTLVAGPTVEDARDETQPPKAPIKVDSRDEATHQQRDKLRAPIPFPKMKSLSMPTWIVSNNAESPTMRCVRTIDESSVLLDEDFLALQQYIELDFLDDSTCTSEMRDVIMDMVLSDIGERGIPPAVSSLSASQLMMHDDDSIDSLEADLASEISGEGITAPPCISQGSDYKVPSPKSAADDVAQKSTGNDIQSHEQLNLESSQTKEKPSDQGSQSQNVDESSPNPVLPASNHSVGLAAQTKRSVIETEKETSAKNGTGNKATTILKSNSTISTVPSAETPKVYDGARVISNLSSLTASAEGGSAAGSIESEESDNSSTTGVEKVHRTASSFDSEAELSTQWDAMLETISQKLFVPTPGLMQAHDQKHDESKSNTNKCDQGHIESFCSTFVSHVRNCFDTAKANVADSFASAQITANSTCVKTENPKQDDDKTITMVKKTLDAINTVEQPAVATDKLQIVVQDGPNDVKETVHESPDSSRLGRIHDGCTFCVQIGRNDSRICCSEQAELQQLVCGNELLNCNAQGDIINLSGPSLSSISMNSLSANPFGQPQPPKQAQIPKQVVSRTTVRNEESSGRPPLAPPSGIGRWRKVLNIRPKVPTLGKTKSQGRSFSSGIKTM